MQFSHPPTKKSSAKKICNCSKYVSLKSNCKTEKFSMKKKQTLDGAGLRNALSYAIFFLVSFEIEIRKQQEMLTALSFHFYFIFYITIVFVFFTFSFTIFLFISFSLIVFLFLFFPAEKITLKRHRFDG